MSQPATDWPTDERTDDWRRSECRASRGQVQRPANSTTNVTASKPATTGKFAINQPLGVVGPLARRSSLSSVSARRLAKSKRLAGWTISKVAPTNKSSETGCQPKTPGSTGGAREAPAPAPAHSRRLRCELLTTQSANVDGGAGTIWQRYDGDFISKFKLQL